MSCFHPCFIQRSTNIYTGEVSTRFIGSAEAERVIECQDVIREKYAGHKTLNIVHRSVNKCDVCEFIMIPCGKCIGCRIDYKRSWADRLTYHSLTNSKNNYFITLTYDDQNMDHLDHSPVYDLYSLRFDDMTEFIKKLRNKYRDVSLDYFYSGEYGDARHRCHFHLLIFNLPLDDLEFWKLDSEGLPIYTSDTIHRLWQKGICSISEFSWLNAAYTAGYVEKKLDGRKKVEYTAVGLTPEACRMSRRPGIAYDYYLQNFENIWKNNGLDVSRSVNSQGHLGIPRYFRKLAENGIGLENFQAWKERTNELSNYSNPQQLEYSSFDLQRVNELFRFQEREILSRQKNKSL